MDCSVVIITYNSEGDIGPCLDSVLDQSFDGRFEVIVVDNGSIDGTRDIVREYTGRNDVHLVELEKNYGAAGGYNRGLPHTTGETIVYLDPDTVVHRDWLRHLYEAVTESDAVAGHSCIFEPYHPEFEPKNREEYPARRNVFELNSLGFVEDHRITPQQFRTFELSGCSMIIERDAVERLEYLFDEEISFPIDDLELGLRLTTLGETVIFVPDSIVYHSQYQKSEITDFGFLLRKYLGTVEGCSNAFFKTMTMGEYVRFLPRFYLGCILKVRVMRVSPVIKLGLYAAAAVIALVAIAKSFVSNRRFVEKRNNIIADRQVNVYRTLVGTASAHETDRSV